MDMTTISLLIALVGCFIGLAGWLSGRDKKISNDSEWKGTVNAKLDIVVGISREVAELKDKVEQQGRKIAAIEQSCQSAHKRINDLREEKR